MKSIRLRLALFLFSFCSFTATSPLPAGPFSMQMLATAEVAAQIRENAQGDFSGLASLSICRGAYPQLIALTDEQWNDLVTAIGTTCTSLTDLDLSGLPIRDSGPLAGCTKLQRLILNNTLISSVASLAFCSGLQELYLGDCKELKSLDGLESCQNLQKLGLARTPVTDLSPLSGLKSLSLLSLAETPVSDLRPLSGLEGLQFPALTHTPVSDLSPLGGLPSLATLEISGTKVEEVSALQTWPALRNLFVSPLPGMSLQDLQRAFGRVSVFIR